MKKRWFLFLMVSLLLVWMLALPALAADDGDQSSGSVGTHEEGGDGGSGEGGSSEGGSGEGGSGEGGSGEGGSGEGGSGEGGSGEGGSGEGGSGEGGSGEGGSGEGGSGEGGEDGGKCTHVWVEVTVPSTCTEPGGVCYVCTVCEEVVVDEIFELAPHTYDSPCDADCNICGAVREAEHKFSAGWDYNSTKHWHPCVLCGFKGDEADHYPGPAATEDQDQICLTCRKVMMTKKEHTHEKLDTWESNGTSHWHPCKDCDEKLDLEDHTFDGACGTPCTVCGYVSEDEHIYEEAWHSSKTEHWKVCALCGAEGQHEAHVPDPETSVCTVCGSDPSVETVHEHVYSETWLHDSTTHWQVCTVCGQETPRAPHAWKSGTPDADGAVTDVCNTCRMERSEAGEAKSESSFPVGAVFIVLCVILIVLVAALLAVLGVFKKPKKQGHYSSKH